MRARQLQRVLRAFRAGRQQKNLVQPIGRQFRQKRHELCPLRAWKHVIVQQALVHLIRDSPPNFGHPVPGIGNQNARTPIEPHIAVLVVHLTVLCAIPHERRLPAHGNGFNPVQRFQYGHRIRMGQWRHNPPILRLDPRHFNGRHIKFFSHCNSSG